MNIKKHIPNFLTCCNLLCGCLAIVMAFEGNLVWTAYLVGIAVIFDFFDGFAARALKVTSPIGKDLDSLADMVTFGVVPGVVMYTLLISTTTELAVRPHEWGSLAIPVWKKCLPFIGFMIPVFSAIRLAKFNNDTRQSDSFIGIPTPANAIFICSLPLVLEQIMKEYNSSSLPSLEIQQDSLWVILTNNYVLIILTIVLSYLLVAPLPILALKFKHFKWKGNEARFIFLILAVALISVLGYVGIPLSIVLLILVSIINNLLQKRSPTPPASTIH